MRHYYFKLFFAALLCIATTRAQAHDFEVDGIYYNITNETNKTVEVTFRGNDYNSYSDNYSGKIVIPATVKYNSVTYNVTSIGNSAFKECSNLISIAIPKSVTNIGNYVFSGCTALKDVRIEDSEDTLSLGYNNIYLGAGCDGLFHDCPLETVYWGRDLIHDKNLRYGAPPFENKSTLTSITIGESVTIIDDLAFRNCSGLHNITIPKNVTSIGNQAFLDCTGLTSIKFNAENCTNIGITIFQGCTALSTATIGDNVKTIPSSLFRNCTRLTSIKIPNNVTNIESDAFDGCTSLTNLYIEEGDNSILTLHGNGYYYGEEGTGLFYSAPLKKLHIRRKLEFEDTRLYGYSPFYNKDIDTIIVSKKPNHSLQFGGGSRLITILYIDPSYYDYAIPDNISWNATVHYFKTPGSESFFNNLKCIKVPLGEITSDYYSISVALNDSLIGKHIVKAGGMLNDATVKIDGKYIQATADNVYRLDGLKIGNNYPVTLQYVYNGVEYTTTTTISTKNISPKPETPALNETTLSTATLKFGIGDTIGLGKPIDEIGIHYNNQHFPAEKDEKLPHLHSVTLRDLRPGSNYYYNIYFKIGTEYYYCSNSFKFSTKSPSIAIVKNENTQTTSSIKIIGSFSDEHLAPLKVGAYFYNDGYHELYADDNNNILIKELKPYTTYNITPFVEYEKFGRYTGETKEITTDSIGIGCAATATATTISLEGTHDVGDATIVEYGFVDWETNTGCILLTGLEPDTEYSFTYYVTTEEGGTVQKHITVRTEQLVFNTLKAKATSNTRAVICAETNISEEESGTGFEWRRIDAPDLVPSEFAPCAVHEGVMEGALHNLSANTYYKYRPCYTSQSGKSYYGEWIGFGTADAYVYFTPTVHTYATASAGTNAARLSGYVLAGSDDIIEQGFEYWPVGKAETAVMHSTHNNGNVKRVTATGQRMSVVVEELDYGTVYMCRAYARTAKETVYGEEQSFETSYPNSIEENREESITIQTSGNTVYINGCNENDTVFVYTLFGAVAYNGPEKEITLNSGTYIVKVGNITKKIQIR